MYGSVAYLPNSKGEMVTTRIFAGSALRIEEILGVIATTLR
ncbi:hypothetical protein [Actinomyces bovis]|nr:hypothetical protein [Actinomyces bovis]